jgi:hypothetical protein
MTANDVDIPGLKEILWHKMRDDLKHYIPQIANTDLLMCPTCCRFLPFEHFNVEHVIPQQALADDPAEVRAAIPRSERSVTILLCMKELLIKGRSFMITAATAGKADFTTNSYERYSKPERSRKIILHHDTTSPCSTHVI